MTAKKPPMGWNSWNTFGDKINEQLIKEMADRIVEDGYRDLGYEYIIIDDCWSLRERVDGKLVADPALFPNGMKALSDYIHSKGLKFGMYSCAGTKTCAGYPSSYGHEFSDAKLSGGVESLYTEEAFLLCKRYEFKNMLSRFNVEAPKNNAEEHFVVVRDLKTAESVFEKAKGREVAFAVVQGESLVNS